MTGANNATNSITQQVTVTAPLVASFAAQPTDLTVQFVDQSSGQIVGWTWDFGDTTGSTDQNPSHTYGTPGTYNVTLTVTGANNATNSITQQVTVTAPLVASFAAQPTDLTVQFVDQSSGQIVGWTWDFGDTTGSTDQNPSHTYGTPGTYNVTLTVTGANNATNSITQQVTVTAPLVASFAAQPTDLTVQFVDQSSGQIVGWTWDFGDTTGSTDQNPSHTYGTPGTYNVTLTVTGANNATNSITQQVTVAAALQADFTPQATDLTVQFTDQSTGQIAGWTWDFGDGTGSNDQSPSHTYAAPGTYTVTLTVTDGNGRSDDQSAVVQVTAPLQASFTAQPTDLTVQFTDQSTGQIAGWTWDFGDSSGSNDQNPSHTYAAGGTYNVTLTVSDGIGGGNSTQQQVTVTAPQQQPPQQTIVDTTPILPDLNALHDILRGIYANGVNSFGNRATVFTTAGDSIFAQPGILSPFASGPYDLSANSDLQAIVDWFNSTDLGGVTSYNRTSLAVNPNWLAQSLLDPNQSDPSCNGEAPLACELHQTQPALMFVAVGRNDALNGTDSGTFQNMLNQIVATISSNGTIPVLMTIPDDGSNPNVEAINEVIITVAQQNNVPLINAARALKELASGYNLSPSPSGAGALDAASVSTYGINALNYDLLRVLSDARNIIFPDA